MLNFIIMTMSVTIGVLLAGAIAVRIMLSKKFLSWYIKKMCGMTNEMANAITETEE